MMSENNVETMSNIEEALLEAANNSMLDEGSYHSGKFFHWSLETVDVRTILKRYKEGRLKLPLCQRLYVWSSDMRSELLDSVKSNLPCGNFCIGECDGVLYLVDGLQRMTSLMLLSNDADDFGMSDEDKKLVLDYKIVITTVHDMTTEDMFHYFKVLNSGVCVSAAIKERSKLSPELNRAVLEVSGHEFFKRLNTEGNLETISTFYKSSHNELIAENALLAACGCKISENTSKKLCSMLQDYESEIVQHVNDAKKLIDRIDEIYQGIDPKTAKRSLRANFLGSLVYIMSNTDHTNPEFENLINYVFGGPRVLKEYSLTTSRNANSMGKCSDRYDLLVSILDNQPEHEISNDFDKWEKNQTGKVLHLPDGNIIDFSDCTRGERMKLYQSELSGNVVSKNQLLKDVFHRLEAQ